MQKMSIISDKEFAKLSATFDIAVKSSRTALTALVLAAARHYNASKGAKDATRLIVVYDKLDELDMKSELEAICLKGGFFADACNVKMYIASAAPHDTMVNTEGSINADFTAICRGVEEDGIQKYYKKLKRNEKRADREQNPDRVNSKNEVDKTTLKNKIAFENEEVQKAYTDSMSLLGKCTDVDTQKQVMQAIKDVCEGKTLVEEGESTQNTDTTSALSTLKSDTARKSVELAIENLLLLESFGDTAASKGNKATGFEKVEKAARIFQTTTGDMVGGFSAEIQQLANVS